MMYWGKLLKRVRCCFGVSAPPWSLKEASENYEKYKTEWDSYFDHYVYVFSEPDDNNSGLHYGGRMEGGEFVFVFGKPFYVGKGSGARCLDHFRNVKKEQKTPFYKKLKQVLDNNPSLTPWDLVTVIKFFKNENDAFDMETRLIEDLGSGLIGEIKDGPLMNLKLIQNQIPHNDNSGEKNQMAKLSNEGTIGIYDMIKSGATNTEIGNRYGLHPRYISLIRHGKRWPHLFKIHLEGKNISSTGQGKFPFEKKLQIVREIIRGDSYKQISERHNFERSNLSRIGAKIIWKNIWQYIENKNLLDNSQRSDKVPK